MLAGICFNRNNFGVDYTQEVVYKESERCCDQTCTIDVTRFNEVFKRADFGAIIKDPVLFLVAFCKIFPTRLNDLYFNISKIGQKIILKGDASVVSIPFAIEELRNFFAEGVAPYQNFEVYVVKALFTYFKKPAESYNFEQEKSGRIDESYYKKYIVKVLAKFANLLGAIYSESSRILPVKYSEGLPAEQKTVEIIRIRWK